jgi:hypothetical protein
LSTASKKELSEAFMRRAGAEPDENKENAGEEEKAEKNEKEEL